MAGTLGNTNSNKNNRLFANTIKRILIQDDASGVKIRAVAEALINKAAEGDVSAIRELGDRLDGKVTQTIAGEGEDGAIDLNLTVTFVG